MKENNHAAELGQPIATRQLTRDGLPITVRIWAPQQVSEEEWKCPFQISGFGDDLVKSSHGGDAVQALQLTTDGIRSELQPEKNGIVWIDREIGDAGFPMHINYSLGADFYYYLCDLMEREIMPDPSDLARSKKLRMELIAEWKKDKATPSGGHSS